MQLISLSHPPFPFRNTILLLVFCRLRGLKCYIRYQVFQDLMQQATPLEHFESSINGTLLRLNLLKGAKNSEHQSLAIYIQNTNEEFIMEQIFTIDKLPKEVITIFFDISTIFDYIVDNHREEKRVKVIAEGMMICNIIKARGTEKRQEIILPMTKTPKPKPMINKEQENRLLGEVVSMMKEVSGSNVQMKRQIERLTALSEEQAKELRMLSERERREADDLRHQLTMMKQATEISLRELKNDLFEQAEHIRVLRQSLSKMNEQKELFKQHIMKVITTQKLPKGSLQMSSNFNGYLLGQKVEMSIDKNNKYINNFQIKDNAIEKINGDLTRFQILGNQIMGKVSNCYYQIKIVKLVSGAFLLGLASLSRRGERESHDHRECVCLDASGMIFEMGKKEPSIVKLQAGQTIRVHLDLQRSVVRWLVGFTEVASVLLPDYLLNSKLVPYLQLNQVGDKISLN